MWVRYELFSGMYNHNDLLNKVDFKDYGLDPYGWISDNDDCERYISPDGFEYPEAR